MPPGHEDPLPEVQKPALLVVDMIYGFTDTESPLGAPAESALAATASVLEAFRRLSLPIYFSTVSYSDASQARPFRDILPPLNVLEEGSRWVQVHKQLARRDNETLIEKHYASCFFGTDLAGQLRDRGVDSVVVCGMTTSGCVRATVVDAVQNDFYPFVIAEAVADRHQSSHEVALHDMGFKYARVLPISRLSELIGSK